MTNTLEETERRKSLPDIARRALEEADIRKSIDEAKEWPTELGGRKGPDPVRYGDWEKKGLAVDF